MTRHRPDKRQPPTAQRAAPGPDRAVWAQLAFFAIVAAWYALRSTGTYQDDDLDHFFMARAAFHHPEFLIDPWGRPAFTLLYALPAQAGLTAVRLTTVLVALLTAFFTVRAARRLGAGCPDTATGLALWQPMSFLLSFGALAEPLAALGIALILDGVASGREDRAALAAGLLPLARLELAVLAAVVAVWLVARRSWRPFLWLAAPLLAWAAVGAFVHGDPLWLPGVIGGTERPLTTAGPVHYLRNWIVVAGPTAFLGFFLGVVVLLTRGPGPKPAFAGVIWLVTFLTLTALTWELLRLGGSIGFLRHLIVMAPATAILALAGYEGLTREMRPARRWIFLGLGIIVPVVVALFLSHVLVGDYYVRPGRNWSRLIGILPPAILVIAGVARPRLFSGPKAPARLGLFLTACAAVFCLATVRPVGLNVEQKTVKSAVDALREDGFLGRPILANHPWFYQLAGRDRWDRTVTPYVTRATVAETRPGTVVVWDSHYGTRLYGDVPVEELRNDPGYRLILEVASGDHQFRVVAFERVVGGR